MVDRNACHLLGPTPPHSLSCTILLMFLFILSLNIYQAPTTHPAVYRGWGIAQIKCQSSWGRGLTQIP